MVGGTIFHREVIQREISRALVLNLSGKASGAQTLLRTTMPLTEPSLLSRGTRQQYLFKETDMTTLGIVGTSEGFVIAADGRMTIDDETKRTTSTAAVLAMESEEAQKIFEIVDQEKTLGYAMAGFVTLDNFLLLEEIKRKLQWLSKRDFDTCKKYLTAVAEKVTDEINEAKRAKIIEKFPAYRRTETGEGWKIADLILVGYFKGAASLACAQFTHMDGVKAECDVNSLSPSSCLLSGSDTIRKAIYPDAGNAPDARFAQYVKQPVRSLQDGEDYIRGFIAACSSELGRELDPECWRITGGHVHLAKITLKEGFAWVTPPKHNPITASST